MSSVEIYVHICGLDMRIILIITFVCTCICKCTMKKTASQRILPEIKTHPLFNISTMFHPI